MKKVKAFLAAVMMLSGLTAGYAANTASAAGEDGSLAGTYLIRNVNSGIYLNVAGGSKENGTNVQQWGTDDGYPYCLWKLEAAEDGYYRIYSMVDGGKNLLLNTGNGTDASDANVCIYENTGADNQLYKLFGNADGSFKILVKSNGNAVEIINAETSAGANVQQWEVNGANCQDWELIPVDGTDRSTLTETKGTQTGEDYIPGDLNKDGRVDGFDAVISKRILVQTNGSASQKMAADVNGDDSHSVVDIVALQKFLLTGKGGFVKKAVNAERQYAAIDGEYTQGAPETTNEGFESESYLNLYNEAGTDAVWNVRADADGVYAVTIRFANGGTADRSMAVKLNSNIVYWTTKSEPTGAWTTWQEETLYLPLKAGVNKLTFTSLTADGAPNIDHITITSTDQAVSPSTPIPPIAAVPDSTGNNGTYGEGRRMEYLNRGVMATYNGSGVLVSWRVLATDPANTTFKLYQNGNHVADIAANEATNYFVSGASASDVFTVDTYVGGMMTEKANTAVMMGIKNSGQSGSYLEIALQKPADQTMPDGSTCSYTPNDCSVGDVDGDGQYEIFVKWDPSNSKDNANDGYTGSVFIDCYKLDGTRLWRIDLGKNIRAGAHYTQFMVYDFDGDGKAEMMVKTADGTVDGQGKVIGDGSKDYRSGAGRILTGPEYLTVFNGETGAAMDTIDFEPARGNVGDWDDTYGNRCDRFLATVAYLDGQNPSAVFGRGYYAKTVVVAYDFVNGKITKRWSYDTGKNSSDPAYNQGNHSLIPMDVDDDGKDEILYGSVCFDDNGTVKWSTYLGHGDCMQAGDLIPERPGLEVFQVHEHHYCAEIHDAATGEIIWKVDASGDVGRGIALNLTTDSAGMEFASTADGQVYAYNPSTGKVESQGYGWNDKIKWSMNSAIWWDDDLEREAMDRTMIEDTSGRKFTGDGSYNNYTKANACLTADILGDWREEVILQANDGTVLRIFGTTFETDTRLFTLMHDSQYRLGVATENVGYNQAPNTSFFLGTGYAVPETPTIYTIK